VFDTTTATIRKIQFTGASLTTKRMCHVVLGLAFGLWASGCRENNPAYLGQGASRDSGVPGPATDTAVADLAILTDTSDVSPNLDSDEKADRGGEGDVIGNPDGQLDRAADQKIEDDALPNPDEDIDMPPAALDGGEAFDVMPTDAPDLRDGQRSDEPIAKDLGVESVQDLDGSADEGFDVADDVVPDVVPDAPVSLDVGPEAADAVEAGPDLAPFCREQDTRDVASPGNPLIGACRAGKEICSDGAWVPLDDEVLPAPAEACNGIDDNCNGAVDEGCADQCIVVAPTESDSGDGSPQNPFKTIEQAIAATGSHDGGSRTRVCVAGGTSCNDAATYQSAGFITMRDGIAVQGNYALTAEGLVYCGPNPQPTTTIEFTAADQGVVFDQGIESHTELSGFVIRRFSLPTGAPGTASSIAGVAVNGGKNVWLSGIFVNDPVDGTSTYGVTVTAGGQATIVGSSVGGGQGRNSAVGVYVDGGSVDLRNNCDNLVAGVCKSSCADTNGSLGIRGRYPGADADTGNESLGAFIGGAGTSPSTVVGNTICGGPSNLAGTATSAAGIAALRCTSGRCAAITGNAIAGGSGRASVGLALAGTGGPIAGNRIEGGCGIRSAAGVLLENASARLSNNLIFGGQCAGTGAQAAYYGLHLVAGGTGITPASESDVHSNDIEPQGSSGDCQSIGVFLERTGGGSGPAAGVLRNNIVSAGVCGLRYAVNESNGAALRLFENNDVYAPEASATTNAVLYHRGDSDATTVAGVNALAGASKNISADPKYASYPTDLHLGGESLCIDRGTATGAPTTDADATPRPQGDGFDIGAYEHTN
jgi:hypothetical protein